MINNRGNFNAGVLCVIPSREIFQNLERALQNVPRKEHEMKENLQKRKKTHTHNVFKTFNNFP